MTSTSYFSAPAPTLDPTLFEGRQLKAWVRSGIQSLLNDSLGTKYRHPELWAHAWLAGSGVSYQWSADREPKDLDCLVGVNFIQFRKANPEYAGLLDKEIADELNEGFHEGLQTKTENWNGFELTFFALTTDDIKTIRPYAAYDLKYDEWTVTPNPAQQPPSSPEWESAVKSDEMNATQSYNRYQSALQDFKLTTSDASRRNAEVKLEAAAMQGNALYEEIHANRSLAFSPTGQGYSDFHNYRWQAAKKNGVVAKLRSVRTHARNTLGDMDYGVDLPDASTLIRRAATYRNK
jgi:hypothetical protein